MIPTDHFQSLQWESQYWGPKGAIKYAQENPDTLKLTPVSWVSLYYSAAGSAWINWKKNKIEICWLLRFLSTFFRAFFDALYLAKNSKALRPEDCCVVGPVLRRGRQTRLAVDVLRAGIREKNDPDFHFETQALLRAELYEMEEIPLERVTGLVWGIDRLPTSLEEVKKLLKGEIHSGQLARVLCKLGLHDLAREIAEQNNIVDQLHKIEG